MSEVSNRLAMDFMENETQFHLGFLPTEQSSPLTKDLDKRFEASCVDGVRCLQNVDNNVLEMAKRIFRSREFASLFRMRSHRAFKHPSGMYVAHLLCQQSCGSPLCRSGFQHYDRRRLCPGAFRGIF